ncbi:MAG: hypothetical protein RL264_558 [Bacteroidota bacterium]|jgi:hypothetical protein
MSTTDKQKIHQLLLGNQREQQKAQGFFDGRFLQRAEECKKKYKRQPKHKNQEF